MYFRRSAGQSVEREILQCFNAFTLDFDLGRLSRFGTEKSQVSRLLLGISVKSQIKKPSVNHRSSRVSEIAVVLRYCSCLKWNTDISILNLDSLWMYRLHIPQLLSVIPKLHNCYSALGRSFFSSVMFTNVLTTQKGLHLS